MAYKVKITALAKMDDGRIGNIAQFSEIIYTDWNIEKIKEKIDLHYESIGKKYVAVIDSIENVKGFCLPVNI